MLAEITKENAYKPPVFSTPGNPSVFTIESFPLNLKPGLGGVHLNISGYFVIFLAPASIKE